MRHRDAERLPFTQCSLPARRYDPVRMRYRLIVLWLICALGVATVGGCEDFSCSDDSGSAPSYGEAGPSEQEGGEYVC